MKHIKLIDRTFNNDIRFKGVFSYRHLLFSSFILIRNIKTVVLYVVGLFDIFINYIKV